jgi:aryl carrier-like protein
LIVLSNEEKINPIPMENIIRLHLAVKAALVVGEYRFNPTLLAEPQDDRVPQRDSDFHEILNEIWPTVQEANKIAPGFAKIPKSLILFAKPGKPFSRAGKGTVQRQMTVKSYASELDDLFSSQEIGLLTEGLTLGISGSADNIKIFTREIYIQALEADNLKDSDDVFQHGMDSLRVAVVSQRLQSALKACGVLLNTTAVDARLVYAAPSIDKMTESILALISKKDHSQATNGTVGVSPRQQAMEALLENYSTNSPSETGYLPATNGTTPTSKPWTVILTGTTGSLGSYLLAALESLPASKVVKIYCLNRFASAKDKQRKASESRGPPLFLVRRQRQPSPIPSS